MIPQQSAVTDNTQLIAALFALMPDWDATERRTGRRGEYRTTGASMYRIREVTPEQASQLSTIAGVLGLALSEEELLDHFSGDYEFQVSYACNRFATKTGGIGRERLTNNELRTLERAKQILVNKEEAAVHVLTAPERKVA